MKTIYGELVADDIVKCFEKAGYKMRYQVLNAKNYGVPQSRERVIFIGVKKVLVTRISLSFSNSRRNQKSKCSFLSLKPYRTFRDATKDLEKLESGESSKKDPFHFAIKHPEHVIKMLKATLKAKVLMKIRIQPYDQSLGITQLTKGCGGMNQAQRLAQLFL